MPLTDTAVRNAKPELKSRKLADEKGLFLLIHSNGSKYWRVKYRFGGKEKLLALGIYPDVSLAQARQRRDDARKLLANQVDPGVYKQEAKRASREMALNSFEAVGREWYAKHSPNWAASHGSKIIRRLERDIFPWIGSWLLAPIEY